MSDKELAALLDTLIDGWENELVEFKQAGQDYATSKIGQYFSALANEANLRGTDCGWLVFGVDDKTRQVCGTDYRPQPDRLQSLKQQMAGGTEPSLTLLNIYQLSHAGGRVLLFQVPAAPQGLPIAWNGHYYARAGESLVALGIDKLDRIRAQSTGLDWTAEIVPAASVEDLDPEALKVARRAFVRKRGNDRVSQDAMENWSDAEFLDRARLTIKGQITRTALLLLGRPESLHFLSPHPAQLTWKLVGAEEAYEHFDLPFLLTTTKLYQRIRNIQLRLLPQDELLPIEVSKYDQSVVMEALHNCIAHQDYRKHARVIVTEFSDRLEMKSTGDFYDGRPEDYVAGLRTPSRYRNPFLCEAMVQLNMIDTMGYGIRRMYQAQARRYFPLPDYSFEEPGAVKITIHGKVIDPQYSRLLYQKADLELTDVLALDRVQKHLALDNESLKRLRKAGLVEGRKPNIFVAAQVADATQKRAEYLHHRGQDDAYCKKLIIEYLQQFGHASRADIDRLLKPKLSDLLDEAQKAHKVKNLLTALRRANEIRNVGPKRSPKWVLNDGEDV